MQNEFVGSFKHAARQDLCEADVNGSMYVQFEDNSNVISTARIAVGGTLSTAATVYDLTQPLAGRFAIAIIHDKKAMLNCYYKEPRDTACCLPYAYSTWKFRMIRLE